MRSSNPVCTAVLLVPASYGFARSGTGWIEDVPRTGDDTNDGDRFGVSIDVEGNTAVVGADLNSHRGLLRTR